MTNEGAQFTYLISIAEPIYTVAHSCGRHSSQSEVRIPVVGQDPDCALRDVSLPYYSSGFWQ